MTPEELTYLAVLLCSIPAGLLFKGRGPWFRQWVGSGLGAGLTLVTCGPHALHSLVTALGTWVLLRATPRRCGAASMLWTFGYLLFFRTPELWGLPQPPPYANALQLLLTLKMVSMAMDVQELREAGPKGVTSSEAGEAIGGLKDCPGLVEILCYSYCYLGLLTGPFYRLSTYLHWLRGPSPPPSPSLVLHRLRWALPAAAASEACARLFPAQALRGPALWGWAWPWRLLYSAPVFLAFRCRFYVAWLCAEASCLSAAFGAYPRHRRARPGCGPTRGAAGEGDPPLDPEHWDFECIRTVDPWGTERCRGVREGLRRWNMTVQWWLQHYVHRRTPGPPLLRAAVTLLVSAYWHGLQGGLYLSLLSLPLWLAAERAPLPPLSALPAVPAAVAGALRRALPMRVFEYLSVGFVLRRGPDVLRYWAAVGFCLHLLPAAAIAAGALLSAWGRRGQGEGGHSDGSRRDGSHGDGRHSNKSHGDGSCRDGSHRDGTHSEDYHSDGSRRDGSHGDGTHGDGHHSNGSRKDGSHGDGRHSNGSHRDGTHSDGRHSDGSHRDGSHSDGTHGDGSHSDGRHSNGSHKDGRCRDGTHSDGHYSNGSHRDGSHGDGRHSNGSHGDGSHGDGTYGDGYHSNRSHRDGSHEDGTRSDAYHSNGSHGDGSHGDGRHSNGSHRGGSHGDGCHSDGTHSDDYHSNEAHRDGTHSDDYHSNGSHGDGRHSNRSHSDGTHSDGAHSNGAHSDRSHRDGTHSDGHHSNGSHRDGAHREGGEGDTGMRRRRGPGDAAKGGRGEEEAGGGMGGPP